MIFMNIIDIYEFTVMFAGLLENAIEMADQDPSIVAPIGECFEDMTEVTNEFSGCDSYGLVLFFLTT